MVRILIISDIHLWSLPNEHDQFYPIRRKLLEDIKDYTAAKGQISHILISGDIAAKGAKDEYKQATQFINELCKKADCPEHEVYLIPGNHDKDFGTSQSGIRHLIHAGMSSETSNIDADDLYREIAEVYVSTGTQDFWNELALRLQMRIAKGINDVNNTQ